MKKSEELRLLLSYNKKEMKDYQLRKQLSLEMTHRNTLLFHVSMEDLFRIEYAKDKTKYFLLKNPLMYDKSWPKDIQSIRQFYVQTKDSNRLVSMDEIIEHPSYKGVGLKRILQDIFATYIEEYNQAYLSMLKKLNKLYYLLPKNLDDLLNNFRKKFYVSLLLFFGIFATFLVSEEWITSHQMFHQIYIDIFTSSSILNTIVLTVGRLTLLLYLVFFMILYSLKSRVKDIVSIEQDHRGFDEDEMIKSYKNKVDKNILQIQLFIEKVESENKAEIDLLHSLDFADISLRNYQEKLALTHKRNDLFQKLYPYYQKVLYFLYYSALFFTSIFFGFILVHFFIEVISNV